MLKPEIDGSSIVLVGSFNPSIFQPAWFGSNDLLRADEASTAEIEAITKDFSIFSVGWLDVQVLKGRFLAASRDSGHASALRDLVLSTFRLLEHTPITAMGLNRQMHFKLPDAESWHFIGDTLAPKERWKKLLSGHIGLLALTIEGRREKSASKYIRVNLQPSQKVTNGIYVDYNEHFEPAGEKQLPVLMENLEQLWDSGQQHAIDLAQQLLSDIIESKV